MPDLPPILGQPKAIGQLQAALRRGAAPAWIFHGPFGVGKATTALRFARLLIDPATTSEAIDRFEAPRSSPEADLFAARHPDVHVITRELARHSVLRSLRTRKLTNIPVDLIREHILGGRLEPSGARILVEAPAYRTSVRGNGKVFIVDEAELLQDEAQNALLKTLEEPPPRTWLIFLTTRIGDLRPTVRSRCQVATFAPLDDASMERWLAQSGLRLDDSDGAWAVRLAAGSPGTVSFLFRHGVASWRRPVGDAVQTLIAGRFDAGIPATFLKLIDALTESIMEERRSAPTPTGAASPSDEPDTSTDESQNDGDDGGDAGASEPRSGDSGKKGEASKVSARRSATDWLLAAVADEARAATRAAVERGEDPERALRVIDVATQMVPLLEANINLRSVMADFVSLAGSPGIATVPFVGRAR